MTAPFRLTSFCPLLDSDDICVTPLYCPPELAALHRTPNATLRLASSTHCWSLGMAALNMLLPQPLLVRGQLRLVVRTLALSLWFSI